ncbi:MAG: D-alanyl-D-alanine carboxypeptidase family protein [Acidimicrobiales bacterium]
MRRSRLPAFSVVVALFGLLSLLALINAVPAAAAQAGEGTETVAAKAWVLIDADTGVVLDARDPHSPRLIASTTKLLTALVALRHLGPEAVVPVSRRAADMPARKLDLPAGSRWSVTELLYGLLLSSANDAAVALAEAPGGSLDGFATQLATAATELGLADHPVVQDPSGLDDADSVGGGNLMSARDLAVVARAVLAEPLLATIVATPRHEFIDPTGRDRSLGNHNKLLRTYDGSIGMKTGYTSRAGQTLVAAANRDGRTLISVVLSAGSLYGDTTTLLDRGFAMAPLAVGTGDRLPPVVRLSPVRSTSPATMPAASASTDVAPGSSFIGRLLGNLLVQLLLSAAGVVGLLRTRLRVRQVQRQRVRQLRRAWADHPATQPLRPGWG